MSRVILVYRKPSSYYVGHTERYYKYIRPITPPFYTYIWPILAEGAVFSRHIFAERPNYVYFGAF